MPEFIKEWWQQIVFAGGLISWLSTLEWRVRKTEKSVSESMCLERRSGCQQLQVSNFQHGKERFDAIENTLKEIRDDIKHLIKESAEK